LKLFDKWFTHYIALPSKFDDDDDDYYYSLSYSLSYHYSLSLALSLAFHPTYLQCLRTIPIDVIMTLIPHFRQTRPLPYVVASVPRTSNKAAPRRVPPWRDRGEFLG
jgi:hypothetical protein